jgi:hypothetical protein
LVETLGLEEEVEKKVREDYTEKETKLKLKGKKK